MISRVLSFVFVAFILTSCGFRPMYGDAAQSKMSAQKNGGYDVAISVIPDQTGQYLRNLLIDRMYQNGYPQSPRYQLNVAPISELEQSLAIAKSAESTRSQLRLTTRLELIDNATGASVLSRDVMAISSYNILVSEFATRVTEENARTNAINDLARQIELQLGLYFNRAGDK
jgi:LPS-assembly lipoprotein